VLTRPRAPVPIAAAVVPVAPPAPSPAPVLLEAVPAADGVGWAAFGDEPADVVAVVEEPGESTAEIEATDPDGLDLIQDLAPWERGFDGEKEDEAPVAR
jgi:hypothetical protein